jgi:hypothetical protein
MDVRFCEAGTTAERHTCELGNLRIVFCALLLRARQEYSVSLDKRLTWKSAMVRSAYSDSGRELVSSVQVWSRR